MDNIQQKGVIGILNETSMTIHKRKTGAERLHALCGQTYHLDHEQLQEVQIKKATKQLNAEKCGNCFEDGRGY